MTNPLRGRNLMISVQRAVTKKEKKKKGGKINEKCCVRKATAIYIGSTHCQVLGSVFVLLFFSPCWSHLSITRELTLIVKNKQGQVIYPSASLSLSISVTLSPSQQCQQLCVRSFCLPISHIF